MTTATETSAITARRAETPAARRDSAPLPTARHRRVKAVLRYGLPPILSFTVGIAAWYAVTYLILADHRRFLLPPPHEVLTDSLLDPVAGSTGGSSGSSGVTPATGVGFWSGTGDNQCFSALQPTTALRPAASDTTAPMRVRQVLIQQVAAALTGAQPRAGGADESE